MKSMLDATSKSLTLICIISLISSPLLLTTTHASSTGFSSHGINASPSYGLPNYAFPSYGLPSYALPSYALPNYALPNYALPNYGLPSYALADSGTDYTVYQWGMLKIFPTIHSSNTYNNLKNGIMTGSPIQIAVLDTGIDLSHPELANSVTWTYDATSKNQKMTDISGHGTHVAGIVAHFGIAEIYAIKVMDGADMIGEWEWLEAGIIAAMNGPDGIPNNLDDADIITMSLGSQGEVPPLSIKNIIDDAFDRDIILIASAGNSGDGNVNTNDLIQYPAAYDNVIAVGATDENDNLAYFSNTNSYVEVVAPGVDIISTYLDGEYAIWSGTSMAAPHVAALCAFLLYRYGSGSSHDMIVGSFTTTRDYKVRGLLHTTSLDLGQYNRDNGYGYGLVQYTDTNNN